MRPPQQLRVSIVVGDVGHPQAVIDDLRNRAMAAVGPDGPKLSVEVIHIRSSGDAGGPAEDGAILRLEPRTPSRIALVFGGLSAKPGAVGAVGRMFKDNFGSRGVASALFGRKDVVAGLRGSSVVVAADPSADRAVWKLRQSISGELVHGPVAMVHALRKLTDR